MSKIESGQLELYPKEMDSTALMEEVQVLLENQVENKACSLADCGGLKQPLVEGGCAARQADSDESAGQRGEITPEGGEVPSP